jgi:hypothetical protein
LKTTGLAYVAWDKTSLADSAEDAYIYSLLRSAHLRLMLSAGDVMETMGLALIASNVLDIFV